MKNYKAFEYIGGEINVSHQSQLSHLPLHHSEIRIIFHFQASHYKYGL